MAAIQPWSAAGAEKPMITFWPGAAFGFASSLPVLTWVFSFGVLLVQAVSTAPAPTAAPPKRMRRRERLDMFSPRVTGRPLPVAVGGVWVGQLELRPRRWVSDLKRNCWTSTAATMMAPLTMFWASVERLLIAKRL